MKIINFGSINIDHVYNVDNFVRPGETLKSRNYTIFSGGKGANQSIAAARAKADVIHVGNIGHDGVWLKDKLKQNGVDTSLIKRVDTSTGHAMIQVNRDGENSIIIHGGANQTLDDSDIDRVLTNIDEGDFLLLQNETNMVKELLKQTCDRDITVIFNPAPMSDDVKSYPLELVDIFIINEVEGETLTGQNDPGSIITQMQSLYPDSRIVLTLGREGVIYADKDQRIKVDALKVEAVDTTGAGDTFIGYFLAELTRKSSVKESLEVAVKASALCVTSRGAADSIPYLDEVKKYKR